MKAFPPRIKLWRSVSLALSILVLPTVVVGDNQVSNDSKICGEVTANRIMKERAATRSPGERDALLRLHGMDPANHDSIDVALYATHELSAAEKKEFAAKGIRVRDAWVPPVPGHHPHGYHLANMSFGAKSFAENDDRVVFVASLEFTDEPDLDIAGNVVGYAAVHAGAGVGVRTGEGVRIAIADSGFEVEHPDFANIVETFDIASGNDATEWSTDVANTTSDHGTVVAGSVAGTGFLSGGTYTAGAPDADLYLYKIRTPLGVYPTQNSIAAILRAVEVESHIFSRSISGWGVYMDGSEAIAQAFDHAFSQGTLCFNSAGNQGAASLHASAEIPPGQTDIVEFRFENTSETSTWTTPVGIRVIWRDDDPADRNIDVAVLNLDAGESFEEAFQGTSNRGTEAKRYLLTPNLPPKNTKVYQLEVTNTASAGDTPKVHFYSVTSSQGTFVDADPQYTLRSGPDADTVIAVGAWVHRRSWTNYQGSGFSFGETEQETASFSSRGPRIDGVMKPEITAPGSVVITTADSNVLPSDAFRISNDGSGDGTGPTNYRAIQGTSFSCPVAAGAAALLVEADPTLHPLQLRRLIMDTARDEGLPPHEAGAGMIDVHNALLQLEMGTYQPPAPAGLMLK